MKNKLRAKPSPTRQFFTYIRTRKKTKSNIGLLKDEGDVLTKDYKQMEEILNRTFASVFTVENTHTVPECPAPPRGLTPLEIGTINEQREVQKYLDKLETSKSTGPNALSPRLARLRVSG